MSLLAMYDRSREFKIISTSVRVVKSSSYVDFTILSTIPPHYGAFSKLNCYCNPTILLHCFTSGCASTAWMALADVLMFSPLSNTTLCRNPLLEVNRLKHLRKASDVKSGRCTAHNAQVQNDVLISLFAESVVFVILFCWTCSAYGFILAELVILNCVYDFD